MNTVEMEALALIDRALNDALSLDEACHFLSGLERGTENNTPTQAIHAVVHFLTDSDLRAADVAYDSLLRHELEEYAKKINTKSQ